MVEIEEEQLEEGTNCVPAATIQLGFSEPIIPNDSHLIAHRSPRWWKDWDGGQIGGKPSWLEPQHLPKAGALKCRGCGIGEMLFLCQLYVPLDHMPSAFHRSFYVFGCPKCCNAKRQGDDKNHNHCSNGIRVLRVQLPEHNPYYPKEGTSALELKAWDKHRPSTWDVTLCQVCGQRANGKCPLQKLWFCGKVHQKEYKQNSTTRSVKDTESIMTQPQTELVVEPNQNIQSSQEEHQSTQPDPPYLPSVYAESEIVVEEEPPASGTDDRDDDDDDDDDDEIEQRPTMFQSTTQTNGDGHDSDEDLEQEDLNEMVTGIKKIDQTATKDPTTSEFYHRIQSRKVTEQCLRYNMHWRRTYDTTSTNRKGNDMEVDNDDNHSEADDTTNDKDPLWIRSDHQPSSSDIPPCPYCQSPRAFEFQLMPQMLAFLHANRQRAPHNPGNDTAKQALIAAQNIIQNSDPSQIPPTFAEAKAKALEALEQDLYRDDCHRVDWGVVAIYTCTASCSKSITASIVVEEDELGVYQEEFAWLQPPLDV